MTTPFRVHSTHSPESDQPQDQILSGQKPPAVAALLNRIARQDAAYFRAHPDATAYTKPYYTGELWPVVEPDLFGRVRVTKTEDGRRSFRIFLPTQQDGARW
jgi:hypothetical protein